MIVLTRLNGTRLLLNCDLIKSAEATPDTTIALVTGEKLVVLDSPDELIARITAYRATVLRGASLSADQALSAIAANNHFITGCKE